MSTGEGERNVDTVVIATEMPFFLVFFEQNVKTVIDIWERWVRADQLVKARHENPDIQSLVIFHPANMTTVQFVPNDPAGRKFGTQTLYTLPHLMPRTGADDAAPEHGHYWTLQGRGFSARFEQLPDGSTGLILGNWDYGRI